MKCETAPGQKLCRRCQRRGLDCILNPSSTESLGFQNYEYTPPLVYHFCFFTALIEFRDKMDDISDRVRQMQQSLDTLVQQLNSERSIAQPVDHDMENHDNDENQLSEQRVGPATVPITPDEIKSVTSSAGRRQGISGMAMTREPTPEDDQAHGPALVTEPMESLYEVTRLRNIRSNQAQNVRTPTDGGDTLQDFISRGVISKEEAESLYQK
jgi:hypothetical protein